MLSLLLAAGAAGFSIALFNALLHAADRPLAAGNRAKPTHRPLAARLSSPALLREFAAGVCALACGLVPPRAAAQPPHKACRGTVVLLTSTLVPRGALRMLSRRLRAHGWRTIIATVRFRGAAIDAPVARLARSVDRLVEPGGALNIVGYGTGGLIARAYAAQRTAPCPPRVITVATPHLGTRARFVGPALRAGSACLEQLSLSDAAPRRFDAIAIYSDFDAWVQPVDDAYYPGAFNIEVRGVGHLTMLFAERVAGLILENLAAPAAPPDAAG